MATGGPGVPTVSKPPRSKKPLPVAPAPAPVAPYGDHAAQHPDPVAPSGDHAVQTPLPDVKPPPGQKPITGHPVPALQQFGYFGSISDFASRVQAVVDAHQQTLGYQPSPGLILDVAKAPVPDQHIPALFDPVRSFATARSIQATTAQPPIAAKQQNADLLTGALDAIKNHTYDAFLTDHEDDLTALLKDDKSAAAKVAVALYQYQNQADTPKQASLLPAPSSLNAGVAAVAAEQVATSLKQAPAGVVLSGEAVALDANDIAQAFHGGGDWTPTRTKNLGVQSVKGVVRDVQHPSENPGYLFIDILGFAGAGSGAAVRIGTAGRLAAAGEAAAAGRALLTRPVGGTIALKHGDLTEHVLASENPSIRWIQQWNIARKNKAIELAREGGQSVPAGMLAATMPDKAVDFIDRVLDPLRKVGSPETKVGREMAARKRVDHVIAMTTARELDAAAGWSVNQARVLARVPSKARRGLTLGEQKAIQVLSVDDANPLDSMRSFHQWAIDHQIGDPAAHQAQLAALKLAEKALANPRPRFQKALALTRQAVAEQEALKIQHLGLVPETADGRVVRMGATYRREPDMSPEALAKAGRQSPDSFYLQSVSKKRTGKQAKMLDGGFSPRVGPFGIPAPKLPPELTHSFSGQSVLAGDFRIDATGLASESYARTVRAVTVLHDYKQLLKSAVDTKVNRWYVPIRESAAIPDELRELLSKVDEGEFTAADAAQLRDKDLDAIHEHLFPDATAGIDGVKWVDSRLLDQARESPVGAKFKNVQKVGQAVNEPFRDITLLLRPAYILNALGNVGMGLIHQGVFLPPNIIRAIHAKHLYGEKVARTMDAIVGESRSKSYVAPGIDTTVTAVSQNLARMWSVITDQYFRRAALVHELRRMGAHDQAGMERLLFDTAERPKLLQASKRANKAMVEFNNLTWYEKNVFRHIIFVYPWVSRSAVWSVRTILEHPVQSAVLVQLGKIAQEQQDTDPVLSHMPAWYKRVGYVPVGFTHDGKPKVSNATSVNSFSTLGDLMTIGDAGFGGNVQYASGEDLLGPFAKFMIHGLTGRDEFGNEYPGSDWAGSARALLQGLPQVSAIAREKKAKAQPPLSPIDVTDRNTLVAREHSALKQTVFSPGWLGGYGSMITGGLTARVVNPDAGAARYWNDQPIAVRHKHEQQLVQKALVLQGQLVGTKVPADVKDAVALADKRTQAYSAFQTEFGRDPTDNERTNLDIQEMAKAGNLTDQQTIDFTARLGRITDPAELKRFRTGLLSKYGGGKELRQWDADVRLVHSFRPQILAGRFGMLDSQGLAHGSAALATAGQDTLTKVGRQYLAYTRAVSKLAKEHAAAGSDPAGMAALREWQDAHDKPIVVDGKEFPSPVRLAWTFLTPDQRQATIHHNVTAGWKSLSAFDKELVGVKTTAAVTKGWGQWQKILADYSAAQPEGHRGTPPGYGDVIARYVDKNFAPGFYKDYQFSRQPLYARMAATKQIKASPNKGDWQAVFAIAKKVNAYRSTPTTDGLTGAQVRDYWHDYVTKSLQPWADGKPAFKKELDLYGDKILERMVGG